MMKKGERGGHNFFLFLFREDQKLIRLCSQRTKSSNNMLDKKCKYIQPNRINDF